jgi:hypothetical protein
LGEGIDLQKAVKEQVLLERKKREERQALAKGAKEAFNSTTPQQNVSSENNEN